MSTRFSVTGSRVFDPQSLVSEAETRLEGSGYILLPTDSGTRGAGRWRAGCIGCRVALPPAPPPDLTEPNFAEIRTPKSTIQPQQAARSRQKPAQRITAYSLFPIPYSLLPTAYCLLPTAYCLLHCAI